jgi:hypothetical protein
MKARALSKRYGRARGRQRFTVEAGRSINFDGEPFIAVERTGKTQPVDADAVTRVIADCLNTKLGKSGVEGMHAQYMAHKGSSETWRFKK